jgi:Na+-translocating ferredoxin:NAD+ oxidoreductase subunit G
MIKDFLKSDLIRMVTALSTVAVMSGVTLVFVYRYSMPKIEANITQATEQGIKNLFPAAEDIKEIAVEGVYAAKDRTGKLLGYAFTAEGSGYQGTIKMIAGISPDLSVMNGIEILESQETPGLGAEIGRDGFKEQFLGLETKEPVEYVKNQKPEKANQIEAITGATISSRAVVRILNDRIAVLREKL